MQDHLVININRFDVVQAVQASEPRSDKHHKPVDGSCIPNNRYKTFKVMTEHCMQKQMFAPVANEGKPLKSAVQAVCGGSRGVFERIGSYLEDAHNNRIGIAQGRGLHALNMWAPVTRARICRGRPGQYRKPSVVSPRLHD